MNDGPDKKRSGRLQLLLVALIFILPLAAASWMYYSGSAPRPQATTNHGVLLTPIQNVNELLGETGFTRAIADHWALVYVYTAPCADACRDALYKLRQSRLMLGNDMNRVVRVMLHGSEAPDTLLLTEEHAGLIALQESAADRLLDQAYPVADDFGGYYLIDPLGNLVLYFPTEITPRNLVDDIEHLLKLSSIG